MFNKIVVTIISAIFVMAGVSQAWAGPDIGIGPNSRDNMAQSIATSSGYSPNVNEFTLSETIGRYIRYALSLIGTIFFVLTVYAGFMWMTAQGNTEQVEKATEMLKTAVIGMIIIFGAYGITWMVLLFTTLSATPGGDAKTSLMKTIVNMIF